MFSNFSILMIMFFSLIFIMLTHPISMGLLILIQTLSIALFTGTITNNFWFSYILFLVFLGGLLVLFTYMTSLASNQTFKFSIFIYSILITMMLMMLFSDPVIKIFNWNFSTFYLFDPSFLMSPYFSQFNKLYISYTSNMTIFLAILLLMTLIIVVNLIKLNKGPLRSLIP